MDVTEKINRLREAIFLKRSTSQDPGNEEQTLKFLEDQREQDRIQEESVRKEIEKRANKLEGIKKKASEIKEKVGELGRQWQEALRELNKLEMEGDLIFEERLSLMKQLGETVDKGFASYPRSVHTGSQRIQWVDDSLFPLTEDFRAKVISDQMEVVRSRRGEKKRVRKISQTKPLFIPEQYEAFRAAGIPIPEFWHKMYLKHQEAVENAMRTRSTGSARS